MRQLTKREDRDMLMRYTNDHTGAEILLGGDASTGYVVRTFQDGERTNYFTFKGSERSIAYATYSGMVQRFQKVCATS